jgi:hypothetical protein
MADGELTSVVESAKTVLSRPGASGLAITGGRPLGAWLIQPAGDRAHGLLFGLKYPVAYRLEVG